MQSIANFEGLSHLPYPFRFSDTSVNNPSFRIQPSQNRTIPRKPPTPLPCFAPSPLPPLSKVRCCRPKKFGRLPEGLPHQPSPRTNPSKNRTIPLAFRRMSVSVCLVGFASLQSTWAHTLRHPCLACPSRCTEPIYPHDHCKRTIIPCSHQPFSKPHYPSKIANTLAFKMNAPEVLSRKKNYR